MLRKAAAADLPQVAQIAFELHEIHVKGDPQSNRSMPPEYFQGELEEFLQGENNVILVSDEDGINAYAAVKITESDSPPHYPRRICFIDCFAVKEGCRRQGVGTRLMEYVRRYGEEQGCTDLQLGVKAFNKAACEFYKAVGFTERNIIMNMKIKKDKEQ